MKLCREWAEFSDLTVFEGAYLLIGIDPKQGECDDEYANYCYERGWDVDASDKYEPLLSAVRSKAIESTFEHQLDSGELDPRRTRFRKSSFLIWCQKHGYEFVVDALNNVTRGNLSNNPDQISTEKDDWQTEAKNIAQRIGQKKWDSGIKEITNRNICDAVAAELGTNTKFHGNRGVRSSSDVRNRGLKGWKFCPKTMDQMEQMD